MGITLRTGSCTTSTLGLLLIRQHLSMSQSAPSRYNPDTKQPERKSENGFSLRTVYLINVCTFETPLWQQTSCENNVCSVYLFTYPVLVSHWPHLHCSVEWPVCKEWIGPVASHFSCTWPAPVRSGMTLEYAGLTTTSHLAHLHPPTNPKSHFNKRHVMLF